MTLTDQGRLNLLELEPLFREAEAKGLWFFHVSMAAGPLWFSPAELRAKHAEGRFVWGAVNWKLRDPYERLAELIKAVDQAIALRASFMARMNA